MDKIISFYTNCKGRIGDYYNLPPFTPSDKCLPKDTQSLYNDCNEMDILKNIVYF